MRVETIPTDGIVAGKRMRSVDPTRVDDLAKSLSSSIGLRTPITVRIMPELEIDGVTHKSRTRDPNAAYYDSWKIVDENTKLAVAGHTEKFCLDASQVEKFQTKREWK
jgi:hypothetical protein